MSEQHLQDQRYVEVAVYVDFASYSRGFAFGDAYVAGLPYGRVYIPKDACFERDQEHWLLRRKNQQFVPDRGDQLIAWVGVLPEPGRDNLTAVSWKVVATAEEVEDSYCTYDYDLDDGMYDRDDGLSCSVCGGELDQAMNCRFYH